MSKWTRRVLSAVMAGAMMCGIAAMGIVQAGALSSSSSKDVYKNLSTMNKNAYANSSKVTGDWDWTWPVPGVEKLSSCYVDRRDHRGIDISPLTTDTNRKAVSAYAGKVIDAIDSTGAFGTYVVMEHTYKGKTFRSLYAHLVKGKIPQVIKDQLKVPLKDRKAFPAGTQVGIVGTTGGVPLHLHFSIWEGTKAMPPKDATLCVDPFLNHFLPVPANMIKGAHYPNNGYTGCGKDLIKNKTGSYCCEYYLDAVKWEWENNRWNSSSTITTTTTKPTTSQPISITSATPNRTSGTTADRYTYTVITSIPATRIEYVFSGNSKVFYINNNGTNNFGAGGYSISADRKTWIWSNDILGAGNPRTVTITAYNGSQKSAPKSFNIIVASPSTTTTTTSTISIVSATPNRTSGTTEDKYTCTVTTNIPATKIEFVFSGNSTVYYINSNGTNNLSAGGYSISADKKTWVWRDFLLGAGNPRTVTITAYNGTQKSASKSFNIVVTAPSSATTTTRTTTTTTSASASSGVVTFNANNGTINTNSGPASTGTRTVNNNAAVGTLPTPTRANYAFNGWFTAQSGGTRIDATTKITANVTYWARWTAVTTMTATTFYTTKNDVPVRLNPFDTDPITRYLAQNTPVTINAQTTNSSGNVWYRTSSGTWIFSGNLAGSRTATFNANGGSVYADGSYVSQTTRNVANGAAVGTLPTATRAGNAFNGWFTAQTGGSRIDSTTRISANVTYWARWTPVTTMTATTYYAVKNDVPIRRNPFDTDPIINRLSQNASVTVVAKTTNSSGNVWYKTISDTWIFSGNLSTKRS